MWTTILFTPNLYIEMVIESNIRMNIYLITNIPVVATSDGISGVWFYE